jgi:hypothetical protein
MLVKLLRKDGAPIYIEPSNLAYITDSSEQPGFVEVVFNGGFKVFIQPSYELRQLILGGGNGTQAQEEVAPRA